MEQIQTPRYYDYLEKYDFIVGCIADLHLNGTPLILYGEEVKAEEYFRMIVEPLQYVSVIVLQGDIIDRTATTNFTGAKKQLHLFFEILDEFNLLAKTVIILGNHDYDARYFLWRKPLLIRPYVRMSLYPYQDVIIHHGDNFGLESLMRKRGLMDSDIQKWRENLTRPVGGKLVRPHDVIIVGHIHRGYCNRKEYTLAVPSVRKILESASNRHLGYLGMFCFCANDDPWDWNIAIESPLA